VSLGGLRLADNIWEDLQKVSVEDNMWLTKPFTLEEIEGVIKEMKTNTAPGPDGFPVMFFKKC
jgi:hypothetical protein